MFACVRKLIPSTSPQVQVDGGDLEGSGLFTSSGRCRWRGQGRCPKFMPRAAPQTQQEKSSKAFSNMFSSKGEQRLSLSFTYTPILRIKNQGEVITVHWNLKYSYAGKSANCTVCPKGFDSINTVIYDTKWVKTTWTYSVVRQMNGREYLALNWRNFHMCY